jgi:hypothetical protein
MSDILIGDGTVFGRVVALSNRVSALEQAVPKASVIEQLNDLNETEIMLIDEIKGLRIRVAALEAVKDKLT